MLLTTRSILGPLALGMLLAACTVATTPSPVPTRSPSPFLAPSPSHAATPSPSPTPSPTTPPSPSPTAPATPSASPSSSPPPSVVPSDGPPLGSVIVTFAVIDEEYRILLTDADDIAIAQQLLAGEEAPSIPNGEIVRGETGVNSGWSWSIDPQSLEFADVTMEVCDGLPSHVEDGTLAGDRFCPWSAAVIAVEPVS